jgi:hypothetical protein
MKFRIYRNRDGKYFLKYRVLGLFWLKYGETLSCWGGSYFNLRLFSTAESAKQEARLIAEHRAHDMAYARQPETLLVEEIELR